MFRKRPESRGARNNTGFSLLHTRLRVTSERTAFPIASHWEGPTVGRIAPGACLRCGLVDQRPTETDRHHRRGPTFRLLIRSHLLENFVEGPQSLPDGGVPRRLRRPGSRAA